jgi:hypothetical protein
MKVIPHQFNVRWRRRLEKKIGCGSKNGAQSNTAEVRKFVKDSWALERVIFE